MNEEEIKKALEIIKQPITVNCIDYHYFDQENYGKLVAVFDNCRWFINNFEQLIDNFNDLQQENARLKDKINMAIKYYELNQQECVIGRNKDEKLIKEYYLPAQCSKKMLDILKEN